MFVFLISNGRSGSTLVHELLARHPDVGFVSNLEDRLPGLPPAAGRFNNALYRRVPPALTRKGRVRYAPSEAWRALSRQVSPMLINPARDLVAADAMPWVAERFRRFFAERALAQAKPVFVHKLTGWPRSGFIRAVFPDTRFVHVVRDGRAVAASDLRVGWWRGWEGPDGLRAGPLPAAYLAEWEASGRSFAVLAGLGWKVAMDAYAAARALVPADQWLDLRYEDLLADPPTRVKQLLSFAGLAHSRCSMRPWPGPRSGPTGSTPTGRCSARGAGPNHRCRAERGPQPDRPCRPGALRRPAGAADRRPGPADPTDRHHQPRPARSGQGPGTTDPRR